MEEQVFNNPEELLEAYSHGFVGAECDEEDTKRLLSELKHPEFGDSGKDLFGSGIGKLSTPYMSLFKFHPNFGITEAQTLGDCFSKDSIVVSKYCKPIQDVKVGDTVYDSNGNFTKVISTQKKISHNPLITIKTKGSIPLCVTSDHRVLIGRKEDQDQGNTKVKVLTKKWVTAQEIKKGDYLITPTSIKTERKPNNQFVNQKDFDWFLGYFLGDGWCNNSQIEITFAEHQTDLFERCKEFLTHLGCKVKRGVYSKSKNTTAFRLRCSHPELASFLRSVCYDENKKKVFPNWAIGSKDVIEGLVASDGMFKEDRSIFDSSSASLAYGVYYSYLSLGYKPTINYFHRSVKGAYKQTQSYRVVCIYNKKKHYSFIKNKELYIPVSQTEYKEGPHEVYDIGVECQEHAFIANGCIAHNCVAHSTRNAIDVVRAVQIDVEKRQESFVTVGATEAIYASRGHTGEGMSCSVAARFVNQTGGVLLRKNYPDLGIDLTRYNGTGWNRQWLRGAPTNVVNEAKKHQVKTTSLIRSVPQARDAIANGYAISVCSNVGFNSRRDQRGISNAEGTWYHAMAWVGVDDTRQRLNETLFLVVNSWGRWNGGPLVHNQPEGSFWIRQSVAERMLSQQGAFVFSNFDGFPAQQLPDYGFGGWL